MAGVILLFFAIAFAGWSPTLAEGELVGASADATSLVRSPRTLHQKKLCRKYGICQGYGGYGGGYQGGYGGYQGNQGYPPINIAISQSQSSANEGGGGYGSGYYPNNYQYNGGNGGYSHGYGGYSHGYGGYNQGYGAYNGYNGYRPGYDNGNGAYNSQFNGNFYSPNGGYNQRPFRYNGYGDDTDYENYGYEYDDSERGVDGSLAFTRSSAVATTGNAESKS